MDRYLTYEGEQPVWLDDFDFMQNSVKDTISRMISAITTDKVVVLQGFEITKKGDTTSWTDGVVAIDGEVLPLKAGQSDKAVLYYRIVSNYSGGRVFKNGSEHQCYESRHVILTPMLFEHVFGTEIRFDTALSRLTKDTVYNIAGNTYGKGQLIKSAGGGYYLQGKLTIPALGVTTDTIIPDTVIGNLKLEEVENLIGTTYSMMTFVGLSGDAKVYPIVISLIQGDQDQISVLVKFAQKISLPGGNGSFYCRIYG